MFKYQKVPWTSVRCLVTFASFLVQLIPSYRRRKNIFDVNSNSVLCIFVFVISPLRKISQKEDKIDGALFWKGYAFPVLSKSSRTNSGCLRKKILRRMVLTARKWMEEKTQTRTPRTVEVDVIRKAKIRRLHWHVFESEPFEKSLTKSLV